MSAITSRRVFIHTFGCQMNELDSAKMYALLEAGGYERASSMDEADLVLVNTCSVRQKAVQKVYSLLGRLRERPNVTVGVTGCVAQQEGAALRRHCPSIRLIMGPDAIPRVVRLANHALSGAVVVDTETYEGLEYPFVEALSDGDGPQVTSFVTIQKGCDNRCAYCVVPLTRGVEMSRPSSEVVAEVEALVKKGVKEVTLLGQNVNSYGLKTKGELTFSLLLERLQQVEGLRRIRFTTSHPRDLSEALMEAFGSLSKVCPYLHLPVQSGSSRVLAAMGRGYTRETYLKKVEALRAVVPGIAISTDFIVGFPGETEAEFQETLELLRQVRFDASFSFAYSPRSGTPAASMPDPVPVLERSRRLTELQAVQKEITLEKHRAEIGRTHLVLVEGSSRHRETELSGRTGTFKTVNFPGEPSQVGQEVWVRITEAHVNTLRGVQIPTSEAV